MIRVFWKKGLRDLSRNLGRSVLVILAVGLGIFGISTVATSYAQLKRDIGPNYMRTNPASATIQTQTLRPKVITAIEGLASVAATEVRQFVVGRIETGPYTWEMIWLFIVADFTDLRISTFFPEQGAWPPEKGEILIERAAMELIGKSIDEVAHFKVPNQAKIPLKIAGTVHDPGQAPAWMEGIAYGYITQDTFTLFDAEAGAAQLKFVVAENYYDTDHVKEVAREISQILELYGYSVARCTIPIPGEHPHERQLRSLMFLQLVFGILALFLSCFLLINMIQALLAGQIRQIGIIKAVGGTTARVVLLYLGCVMILCIIAFALAIPLGVAAGKASARLVAGMLNFEILTDGIPITAWVLMATGSLSLPLMASLVPILKGSSIPVRKALDDYGVSVSAVKGRRRKQGAVRFLSNNKFLLSIRNTFRKRERLVLTISVIVLGGGLFITTINLRVALTRTVGDAFQARNYGITLKLTNLVESERIQKILDRIPDIEAYDFWIEDKLRIQTSEGQEGGEFVYYVLPAKSDFLKMEILQGTWLRGDEPRGIVVNHGMVETQEGFDVGKTVTLKTGDQWRRWKVIGIVKEVMSMPKVYIDYESFIRLNGFHEVTNEIQLRIPSRIVSTGFTLHGIRFRPTKREVILADVDNAGKNIEKEFEREGIDIYAAWKVADMKKNADDHMKVAAVYVSFMTFLILLVGGLGLIITMGLNVLERTREIGILRSIGSSDRQLYHIIIGEGLVISCICWALSLVLAIPAGLFIGNAFGKIFFETALDFTYTVQGPFLWLFTSLIFGAVASFFPAKRAARISVRNALAYE